jgi:hypothetical protein
VNSGAEKKTEGTRIRLRVQQSTMRIPVPYYVVEEPKAQPHTITIRVQQSTMRIPGVIPMEKGATRAGENATGAESAPEGTIT